VLASPVLTEYGRRVGGLGPGLTSESADALSGCPANDSSAGSQVFFGNCRRCRPDLPGLCKRPGFTGPAASGCVPPLQPEKRDGMTIVETRAVIGGVDTHADMHVAAALDPIGGLLGVQEFPVSPVGYACLLGWLGGSGPSPWSASKGPAATARAWPGTSPPPGSGSSRRTVPIARTAAGRASPPAGCGQRCLGCPVGPGPRYAQGPGRPG
jgi:hypothetical protein